MLYDEDGFEEPFEAVIERRKPTMKQNKLLAVLLALLLCAMLPLSAMAATEYSFQLIPGDDMASVDAIKDLFDVLTVRFLKGEGSGMLTLSLSGEDVFSAATRMTGDGLYLDSAILGDKPVYASAEDIGQVLTQLATADEGADEEMVSQIKPMIAQLFSQAGMMNELKETALADPSVNLPDETFNSEEMRAQIKKAFADDEAMADYVLGILDRAEITEGSFTSEAHDPATQSIKITLTKDDVATLQSSTTVQKMLTDSGSMTEEEAAAELKKAMDNMEKMDVVMTMYADDSHLVALEMTMDSAMTVTDDDGEAEKESVQMTATYNRLTVDGTVNHSATMLLGEDGKTEADLAFVLTAKDGSYTLDGAMNEVDDGKEEPILTVKGVLNSADSKADGWLAMLADENQITFTYTGSTEGDQTERLVSLYARENAVAITELAASERPLFSLRVTTSENADDNALKAIESATAENAVQPLQMSDDELTEYLTSISTNATQVLYTVLSKLPSSVIELLTATNGN